MTTGDRIRELRAKKGLTQKDLAHLCGLSLYTISQYERDQCPRYGSIEAIAVALNTSPEYLLGIRAGAAQTMMAARERECGVMQRWQPHEGHRFTKPYTRRTRKEGP